MGAMRIVIRAQVALLWTALFFARSGSPSLAQSWLKTGYRAGKNTYKGHKYYSGSFSVHQWPPTLLVWRFGGWVWAGKVSVGT